MSSIPSPRNYNPSKPVIVGRIPTLSLKSSSKPGLGHDEDDDQVMLLHDDDDKSYKHGLEDSCNNTNNGVLKGSALVPRGHVSDGNHEVNNEALKKDYSGRERLKRHREEIAAGRVLIPDQWGKEELLKDWINYSSFDSLLAPNGVASARKALMAEVRGSMGSPRLRIESYVSMNQ